MRKILLFILLFVFLFSFSAGAAPSGELFVGEWQGEVVGEININYNTYNKLWPDSNATKEKIKHAFSFTKVKLDISKKNGNFVTLIDGLSFNNTFNGNKIHLVGSEGLVKFDFTYDSSKDIFMCDYKDTTPVGTLRSGKILFKRVGEKPDIGSNTDLDLDSGSDTNSDTNSDVEPEIVQQDKFSGKWIFSSPPAKNINFETLNAALGTDYSEENFEINIGNTSVQIVKNESNYTVKTYSGSGSYIGSMSASVNKNSITFSDNDQNGTFWRFYGQINSDGSYISGSWKYYTASQNAIASGSWSMKKSDGSSSGLSSSGDNLGGNPKKVIDNSPPADDGDSSNNTVDTDTENNNNNKTDDDEKNKNLTPNDKKRKDAGMPIYNDPEKNKEKKFVEKKKAKVEKTQKKIEDAAEKNNAEVVEAPPSKNNNGFKRKHIVRKDEEIPADKEKEKGKWFKIKYMINEKIIKPGVNKIMEKAPVVKHFAKNVQDKIGGLIFSDDDKVKIVQKDLGVDKESAEAYHRFSAFEKREGKFAFIKSFVTSNNITKNAVKPVTYILDKLGMSKKKHMANAAGLEYKTFRKKVKESLKTNNSKQDALKYAKKYLKQGAMGDQDTVTFSKSGISGTGTNILNNSSKKEFKSINNRISVYIGMLKDEKIFD